MDVITDLLEILQRQSKVLESMSSANKTVDKNIVKSPNSSFNTNTVSSHLNSNEKKRTKEASNIFIKQFFDEQARREKDTALKTSVVKSYSNPSNTDKVASSLGKKVKDVKKSTMGFGDIAKVLGLAALGALAAFSKIGPIIRVFLSKLDPLLKKLLGKIGPMLTKILSKVGGLIKKVLSKAGGLLKKALSRIGGLLKGIFTKAGKAIKSTLGRVFRSIGKSLSGLWGRITSSNAFKVMEDGFEAAKAAIGDLFASLKEKIVGVIAKVTSGIKSVVPSGVKNVVGASKGIIGKALSGGASLISKGASAVGKGAAYVGKGVVKGATAVGKGVVSSGKGAVGLTVEAAKDVVKASASGIIKGSGGMFKLMGRLTAKGASKVPIIGPAIETILAAYDIKGMKEKLAKGEITEAQLQQDAGKRVISGVTGLIGSAGGAALGGTLGSIVPVAGNAIGAIVGAVGGDVAGRFLGGLISDYVIPPKYTKTIGAFVTGTTPPKEEMQDFILKDGQLHKFSKKDEVMGLKKGGAINEFLRGGGKDAGLKFLLSHTIQNTKYLAIIANNTGMMARNGNSSGGGNATVVMAPQTSSPTERSMIGIPNNRDGYLSSSYALG